MAAAMVPLRPNGQHRHPHDLPLGGAERLGGFDVAARGLPVHLAGDGGDDRQDHHGEDDTRPRRSSHRSRRCRSANSGNQPSVSLRNCANGVIDGGENERAPQPEDDRRNGGEQVDDAAEEPWPAGVVRSWSGRSRCRSTTGTASTSANAELSTVTTSRSRMPKRRFSGSVVENSVLVRKFTLSAASDGIACASRNTAISTMDDDDHQARGGGEPLEHGVADRVRRVDRPRAWRRRPWRAAFRSGPDPGRRRAR